MRFDELFDDLEEQLRRGAAAAQEQQRVEEHRLRIARLTLRDRLAAFARPDGPALRLQLVDGSRWTVRLLTVGRDWLAVAQSDGGEGIVPVASVAAVEVETSAVAASLPLPGGDEGADDTLRPRTSDRVTLPIVLRDLSRRRVAVDVHTRAGSVHGTIDRVGADHLDLARHERGVPRRSGAVAGVSLIALAEVVRVAL